MKPFYLFPLLALAFCLLMEVLLAAQPSLLEEFVGFTLLASNVGGVPGEALENSYGALTLAAPMRLCIGNAKGWNAESGGYRR